MKIHWPFPILQAGQALRLRAESLGYVSIPDGLPVAPDEAAEVLHVICPRSPLDGAVEEVRAARQMLPPDAVLLAAGEWLEPSDIGRVLAAGADDYVHLHCETRELAVRLLALRLRVEDDGPKPPPLDERLRRAQRLETLGSLAGALAHNYNNLLAAIQGNAQLALMDRNLPDGLRYTLTQIDNASQRAGDLTRQMLAYARNQEGAQKQSLNLNLILQEVSELLRVSVPKGCEIKLSLARNTPPVSGSSGELRQLILNLAWTACERIGELGGELRLRTHFEETPSAPLVVLEVAAAGPPDQERIAYAASETGIDEAALRLEAARLILQSHNGTLEIRQTPEGPVLRATIPPIPGWHMTTTAQPEQVPAGKPATVLLVEDEAVVRDMAEKFLRRAGYTVFSADNAAEAWGLCEQVGVALNAVILDLHVPGMKTREMMQGIRSMFPGMQIIIWSGVEQEAVQAKLAGAEPYHFLPKQPKMSEFVSALDGLLRTPRQA
ncbi:MAG: response regulator [Acidobacteria bacterium]|nr:response regulator [Acidobacteriota bacterium]